MRLNVSTSIDVTAREKAGDNLLFLGFHGFSNDENEMIRIMSGNSGQHRAFLQRPCLVALDLRYTPTSYDL